MPKIWRILCRGMLPRKCCALDGRNLPNFVNQPRLPPMTTMNISLPDTLKQFVDSQVATAGYGTSSEYVRQLIRRDQERNQLRSLLVEGAQSVQTGLADDAYFASLRSGIHKRLHDNK